MKNIVLFASGAGSNAENIIRYFASRDIGKVAAIFTNNQNAGVIEKAKNFKLPVVVFSKEQLANGDVNKQLYRFSPSLIVLAGFLLKMPDDIINSYRKRIINIHPALLPKYGGKGMYGMNVHRAILENKEVESGISVHYVDEHYDNGDLIFQARVAIESCNSAEEIAEKIHALEHEHFPGIIESLLK